jgi:prepilin-type N-terminal cleavage/methylation domain-containing protein
LKGQNKPKENEMKTRLKKQGKKGFTLVELMIVAIIVAILAAVVIPLMAGNRYKAIATEAEAGLGTIATAMKVYYAENGTWPTTLSQLSSSGLNAADLISKHFANANGTSYVITTSGANYVLTATASSGASGTVTLNYLGVLAGTGDFSQVHN